MVWLKEAKQWRSRNEEVDADGAKKLILLLILIRPDELFRFRRYLLAYKAQWIHESRHPERCKPFQMENSLPNITCQTVTNNSIRMRTSEMLAVRSSLSARVDLIPAFLFLSFNSREIRCSNCERVFRCRVSSIRNWQLTRTWQQPGEWSIIAPLGCALNSELSA